ncbi:MAG: (d)CMP kinase [Planctomycetes bacterium]|nr:(d)CMP kinase [Planctomycetota bacterium]
MIVTIDGPAGAGKSRAARDLAKKLGFRFLDTGAMYRAITLKAAQLPIDWADTEAMARIAQEMELNLTGDRVFVDGEDVTDAIRTFDITTHTHHAADNPAVRDRLVELQRQIGSHQDLVTEGRDQATVVFPKAECKIYLTASDEVRARRRYDDLRSRGEQVTFEEVLEKQLERDTRDFGREYGGLRKAEDSIEVNTDGMTPEDVVRELEKLVRSCQRQ